VRAADQPRQHDLQRQDGEGDLAEGEQLQAGCAVGRASHLVPGVAAAGAAALDDRAGHPGRG
jgi:hypothetical protein